MMRINNLVSNKKASLAIAVAILFLLTATSYSKQENVVEVLKLEGAIGPVAADRLDKALKKAIQKEAQCLIIQLDTPGGLDKSMRQMVKTMMNSEIPIVVYVSPKGARAASAGVFIALASHIAVMAPGTNIGAAHPVALGLAGTLSKEMEEKVVNDAAAYIKSIAQKQGRNVAWAERAVRDSVSVTAEEALGLEIIDFIAEDMGELLRKLDGREVDVGERSFVIRTKGANLDFVELTFREKILQTLAEPNIAYILLMVGIWGIILEFFHPGMFLPGIAGAICLILSFFALQLLPFSLVGLLLIILAVILFILEANITSYGALTIGGIIALTLGSLMLISPSAVYLSISLRYVIAMVAVTSSIFIFIVFYAIKAQFRKPATGLKGMVGTKGIVRNDLTPKGKIQIHGEIWNAILEKGEERVKKGDEVKVVRIEGMRLVVKKP